MCMPPPRGRLPPSTCRRYTVYEVPGKVYSVRLRWGYIRLYGFHRTTFPVRCFPYGAFRAAFYRTPFAVRMFPYGLCGTAFALCSLPFGCYRPAFAVRPLPYLRGTAFAVRPCRLAASRSCRLFLPTPLNNISCQAVNQPPPLRQDGCASSLTSPPPSAPPSRPPLPTLETLRTSVDYVTLG